MSDETASRKAQMSAIFDGIARDYDAAGPGCFAHFGRRLAEVADVEPGQRVLDVATGRGAVLGPAAERAGPTGEAIGIDLSEAMVRLTGEEVARRGLRATTRVMDAEALDFPDASFDRVLCGFGVMFFPNLPRALSEFRRVLKPGGRLGVSTWRVTQTDDLEAVLARLGLMEVGGQSALRFRDPAALERPLVAAGFAGVRVAAEEVIFHYADEEQYWQNARGTGLRRWLDTLDDAGRERAMAALGERLRARQRPDGLTLAATALLAVGSR